MNKDTIQYVGIIVVQLYSINHQIGTNMVTVTVALKRRRVVAQVVGMVWTFTKEYLVIRSTSQESYI